ncbi:MAG: hypothetical protein ACYDAR_20475 [Thermomicrobiales bacterium]
MAHATFDELKIAVATKAEETGTLPSSIRVRGMQYTLRMPVEMKIRAMQTVQHPARLDAVLDAVTFVGTDGSEVHG